MSNDKEQLYNVWDCQLHEYYLENITLAEAKETAVRLMEQLVDEDYEEYREQSKKCLDKVESCNTYEGIAYWLSFFDYSLEEVTNY